MKDINESIIKDLRWKADDLVISPTYDPPELWWLKQMSDYITECCPEKYPCKKHRKSDYYDEENRDYRRAIQP